MNNLIIPICISIAVLQSAHAYLRFLAFKKEMNSEDIQRLWCSVAGFAALSCFIYYDILNDLVLSTITYKTLLILGWIPYFLIFLLAIPRHISLHVFVLGMSGIWSFFLYTLSSFILVTFFNEMHYILTTLIFTLMNILLFILLLPIERHFFSRLLPLDEFFRDKNIGLYIASLPLSIFIAHIVLTIDNTLLSSWEQRLSRFYLPLVFLCCYHYVQIAARQYKDKKLLLMDNQQLSNEMVSLVEHRLMLQKNRTMIKKFRQTFLASYDRLLDLIEAQKGDEIKAFLQKQEQKLPSAAILSYSDSPIINTAISIYNSRTQKLGINFSPKVNLPSNFTTDENDLSILLSNLLENALQACIKEQDKGHEDLEITLKIQHNGQQCVISITNPCSTPIDLDEEGLPRATRQGHGIGMVSLKLFLEKYHGYATFTQKNNQVNLFLYWRDNKSC
ncbi:ATP-binding region, ATPase domain protein [Anaerovibrio sp. JC8]|uniref:GHKL domain-containing protein n=1 Tax=Anaerovibrio sp. JC8 TaxID=1240085 RepID=UPI000A097FD4|nr:GHKL domain-containing protein [Anaerovibrio sp. JC8]ORT99147.1 ATP-binding region, ATPase domain protein [Anaerovibrio sp. JC8]